MSGTSSINDAEIDYFEALADEWWNERGPFAALQAMTPARVRYISRHCKRLLGKQLDGVSVIDIGCGGGLLAEPLARLGAKVTGIDVSAGAIAAASDHAKRGELDITYKHTSAEDFLQNETISGTRFDIIIASEVIEHVNDRPSFLKTIAKFGHDERPSMVVVTTINRSIVGVLLAKYAAEYILNLTPKGTHDPRKFVRPQELKTEAANAGIDIDDIIGIRLSLKGGFALGGAPLVNYAASGLISS